MASEHREVVTPGTTEVVTTPAPAAAVDRTAATAYDPYAGRRHASYRLVQAVYLVFGLIEALLVIRFVLRALGANASAGFAQFIYGLTAPLVAPFVGLFGNPQAGGSVLELHSIVALVVWRGTVDRGGPVPSSPFTPWKCLRMTLSGDAASPTSIMINKYPPAEVARVLLLVVGFGLGAYVLWRIQEVLVLLFIAILLATAIEPIVNRLRRGPFTRGSGVLVVYTAIMLVIGVAGYLVVPNVLGQAGSFAQSLPERLQALRTQVAGLGQPSVRGVLLGLLDQASRAVQSPAQPGQEELVAVGTAAAQTIISVVTVFVLAFYWLVERATIKPVLLRSVPPAPGQNGQHGLAGGGGEAGRLGARPAHPEMQPGPAPGHGHARPEANRTDDREASGALSQTAGRC